MTKSTDYLGNFVYEDNILKYILTAEGKIAIDEVASPDYQYFLKDHLGNTRVVFNSDSVLQASNYYPFGLLMENFDIVRPLTGNENKYLYNGKELQSDFGLDWYDYGARFYDAQLGRWHSIDPLSDIYNNIGPNVYVHNNPINRIDPNGMADLSVANMITKAWQETPENGSHTVHYSDGKNDKKEGDNKDTDNKPNLISLNYTDWFSRLVENFLLEDNNNIPEEISDELPFNGKSAKIISSPDMISITMGGKFFYITGMDVEAGLVYIKDDGLGVIVTFKRGVGKNISYGGSITAGWYSGDESPSIENSTGVSFYIDKSGSIFSLGVAGAYDPNLKIPIIGRPWTKISAGISLGTSTIPITTLGSSGFQISIVTPIQ